MPLQCDRRGTCPYSAVGETPILQQVVEPRLHRAGGRKLCLYSAEEGINMPVQCGRAEDHDPTVR